MQGILKILALFITARDLLDNAQEDLIRGSVRIGNDTIDYHIQSHVLPVGDDATLIPPDAKEASKLNVTRFLLEELYDLFGEGDKQGYFTLYEKTKVDNENVIILVTVEMIVRRR